MVNLVTRLCGEAYAFYKTCTPEQRGSYEELAAALTKRFTPVRIQAVQSTLFHERKQKERESVDSYAQVLRVLFHKAYPCTHRGSSEAESLGKAVLATQFASGLLPQIKVTVAGIEGDFDTLLAKARFEEARLRDLAARLPQQRKPPSVFSLSNQQERGENPSGRQPSGPPGGQKVTVRCFGCGEVGHYKSKCPARDKGGPAETPGRGQKDRGQVANLALHAPEQPQQERTPGEDDGVGEALRR